MIEAYQDLDITETDFPFQIVIYLEFGELDPFLEWAKSVFAVEAYKVQQGFGVTSRQHVDTSGFDYRIYFKNEADCMVCSLKYLNR